MPPKFQASNRSVVVNRRRHHLLPRAVDSRRRHRSVLVEARPKLTGHRSNNHQHPANQTTMTTKQKAVLKKAMHSLVPNPMVSFPILQVVASFIFAAIGKHGHKHVHRVCISIRNSSIAHSKPNLSRVGQSMKLKHEQRRKN